MSLILTRRIGETLCIGDDVRVTIIQINKGQVRVGIEAPAHINIVREEIKDRGNYQRQNGEFQK